MTRRLILVACLLWATGADASLPCSNPPCPPYDPPPPTDPACRAAWDDWMRADPGLQFPQLRVIWEADYPRCWVLSPSPSSSPMPH